MDFEIFILFYLKFQCIFTRLKRKTDSKHRLIFWCVCVGGNGILALFIIDKNYCWVTKRKKKKDFGQLFLKGWSEEDMGKRGQNN